ncbi:MAG: hypothetical protein J3K34DRAFT_249112 [Monoraphidium minutum]|nr:MAG: hypothetical protein J3K34DRAFT_249112 [Monoraphidium minutum]
MCLIHPPSLVFAVSHAPPVQRARPRVCRSLLAGGGGGRARGRRALAAVPLQPLSLGATTSRLLINPPYCVAAAVNVDALCRPAGRRGALHAGRAAAAAVTCATPDPHRSASLLAAAYFRVPPLYVRTPPFERSISEARCMALAIPVGARAPPPCAARMHRNGGSCLCCTKTHWIRFATVNHVNTRESC